MKFFRCVLGLCALLSTGLAHAVFTETTEWSSYPRLPGIGAFGIVLMDLEGTGYRRIIASAKGPDYRFSAIAVYDGPEGALQLEQLIQLAPEVTIPGRLVVYRLPNETKDRLGLSINGEFVSYGEWPLRRLDAIPLPSTRAYVTSIYDLDSDGQLELLGLSDPFLSGNGAPFVARLADGSVDWTDPSLEVADIAAGHVGTRADPVIVISQGELSDPGLVLSGPTREVLWTWLDGFRGRIRFGNYAGDSSKEFAIISTSGYTTIFRASPTFSPIFQFETGEAPGRDSHDLDGDGYDEIIIGEGQWGSVTAYDARTGASVLSVPNPVHGVSAVVAGRLRQDSTSSLVHGAGLTSIHAQMLRVISVATGQVVDQLEHEVGPFSASTALRQADGRSRVAYATTKTRGGAFPSSAIYLLDPDTGVELQVILPLAEAESRTDLKLLAANLDADPQDELIVYSHQDHGFGYVGVRDGESLQLQWQFEMPDGVGVDDGLVADIDGNGSLEIVVTGNGLIHVLDGANGQLLWTLQVNSNTGPGVLAFGPLLTSGQPGIALYNQHQIRIVNPINRTVDRVMTEVQDLLGQDTHVAAGNCEHRLHFADRIERRNCGNGTLEGARTLARLATMVRLPGAFSGPVLLSDGRRMLVQEDDQIRWQSGEIDSRLGFDNQGFYVASEENWQLYAGGNFGFHRIDLGQAVFANGFETD